VIGSTTRGTRPVDVLRGAALATTLALAIVLLASPAGAQGGAHGDGLGDAMGGGSRGAPAAAPPGVLRICADPNNMPFSDRAGEGFENRIGAILAAELHERPVYTWWAQRRGFIRNTLGAHRCDVVLGIIAGDEQVSTTRPYYRSTYVFVAPRRSRTARAAGPRIASFDDPRLRGLRIGVHVIGADYNSLPPAVALAQRDLVHNVVGYSIYGNYAEASPPSKLIDAVGRGAVDIAVAWGPLAGYFAQHSPVPLTITPVETPFAGRGIPFTYDIAVGVRHGDAALRARLDRALVRRHDAIERILRRYGVPLVRESPGRTPPTAAEGRRPCTANQEDRTCAWNGR